MDYKEIRNTIAWHSIYSDLTGREWQVLAYLVTHADYKSGTISIGYKEIASRLNSTPSNISRVIRSLIGKKAIHKVDDAIGRAATVYRIRPSAELDKFFSTIEDNRKYLDWMKESDRLWGNMIEAWEKVQEDVEVCDICNGDEMCHGHRFDKRFLENKTQWKEYQLWLADNPKPETHIKMVKGRQCDTGAL